MQDIIDREPLVVSLNSPLAREMGMRLTEGLLKERMSNLSNRQEQFRRIFCFERLF